MCLLAGALSLSSPPADAIECRATVQDCKLGVIAGRSGFDYLICVTTGRVIEFSSEKLKKLRDEIAREHGFEAISHQFHIFGLGPEGKKMNGAKAK